MTAVATDWTGPSAFHLWIDDTVDPPCLGVAGEIDLQTCAAFRQALSEAADLHPDGVCIDLRRVEFMGSTGIRELVRVAQSVPRVEVHGARPNVRRALDAANLTGRVIIITD